MLSIPKGQKEKSEFFNGLEWYRIVSYRYRFVSIGIVSYRKKIKGTHPYRLVGMVSPIDSIPVTNIVTIC